VALARSVRVPVEWAAAAPPFRPPLAVVIPSIDVIALGSAALVARLDGLGLAYTLIAFAVLVVSGRDRARINPQLGSDAPSLIGRLAVPVLLVAPIAASNADLARLVRITPLAIVLVLVGRAVSYAIIRETRARGFILEPTLVVGAGQLGARLVKTLQDNPSFGLAPVGFLDSFDDVGLPAPILGSVEDLDRVVRVHGVTRVIIAFGGTREAEMITAIRACDRLRVELHVMPRFFELGVATRSPFTDDVRGIPLIRLRRSALRTAAWRTKRIFDLVVGSLMMLVTAPLFGMAALAVKLSGPGPIFFRQDRIGQRGQEFGCLKFRTMHVNEDSDTTWTVAEDDRRTRAGRILRATGIDELPQLVNVLKGEMSLVGPRPERPYFADQFRVAVPSYDARHRVPVGITGWAQVHGLRGDTSIEERAVFDNNYVENWSLWLDLLILGRTIGALIRHEGD
jgi:exopolysaccharide biosynthesis polyprenyl glycosylphosphotransferase